MVHLYLADIYIFWFLFINPFSPTVAIRQHIQWKELLGIRSNFSTLLRKALRESWWVIFYSQWSFKFWDFKDQKSTKIFMCGCLQIFKLSHFPLKTNLTHLPSLRCIRHKSMTTYEILFCVSFSVCILYSVIIITLFMLFRLFECTYFFNISSVEERIIWFAKTTHS